MKRLLLRIAALRIASLCITFGFLLAFNASAEADELDIWFGTGGNNAGQPEGIYHSAFNTETGDISKGRLALKLRNAGWITWHPKLPLIYATASVDGKPSICSIKVAEDKSLSIAQTKPINDGSCFVTTDRTGSVLISTQYGGGSVISIPIADDGMLDDSIQEIKHEGGSNVVPGRQKSPHPHYAEISPDNKFVFVPDLGLDQLVVYKLDLESQKLVPTDKPVDGVAGGGARHMKILDATDLEDRKFAFVVNELAMSLSCFVVNNDGTMKMMGTEPTLTEEQRNENDFNSGSEVRIHPNGKFVYSANRGHDSISVFHFGTRSFMFKRKQTAAIHGAFPRNFNLTPDGKWLLAAGANSNSVSVFAINQEDGTLTYHRKSAFVPGAICVSIR